MTFLAVPFAMMIFSAAGPIVPDQATKDIVQLYRDCVLSEAIRLDERTERAEVIASAAITSCSRTRGMAAAAVAFEIKRSRPNVSDDDAVKLSARAEDKSDVQLKAQAVLRILEARKRSKGL